MRLVLATCGLMLAAVAPASAAERVCDQRERIVRSLADAYDEVAHSVGLDRNGNLLEIFVSARGSWTAVITNPAGHTCVVAVGEAWEQVAQGPGI